ncbi:hypothetical protein F5Y17DRAFT_9806 [Xylariaceae sp. FL0594]|nr:hypothetical protein F5Y17DRAFT_9806 [Xylariaceae sp. FL0594]
MATGGTAPPPLSIPPPQIEPLSDDDGSSPLSDVEDKDDETNDLQDDLRLTINENDDHSLPDNQSDANDTEAETERLFDTPQLATRHKDVVLGPSADAIIYERTPSKLRRTAGSHLDPGGTPLSYDDVSIASSPPAQPTQDSEQVESPPLDILPEVAAVQGTETRKRKRLSLPAEVVEVEMPPRKRAGSAPTKEQTTADSGTVFIDDGEPPLKTVSGKHYTDRVLANTVVTEVAKPNEQPRRTQPEQVPGAKKQTRSSSRKLKDAEETAETDAPTGDSLNGTAPDNDEAHTGDDDPMEVDVDEEAEAAHKNEEERMARTDKTLLDRDTDHTAAVERKKAAFEQLCAIEKDFTTFREKLFEERLEQLNREEAMLRSANPTHPEYLAMMHCINARRDERIRVANQELKLSIETAERCAVARRAQIHSHFFQAIRESRERILAELGQHWYDIQHERRKHANNVPDFGLRFPKNPTERVRHALSYNREVSILSGIAKYEGMPAAPDMQGVTLQELEDDLDTIARHRLHAPRHHLHRPMYADYGGIPLGEALGPAGAEFLEQTPWANPHHPSHAHLLHRQHAPHHHEPQHVVGALSGAPAPPRRLTHQTSNPFAISSDSQPFNGHARTSKNAARQATISPEVTRAATLLEHTRTLGARTVASNPSESAHSINHHVATTVATS